MIKATDLRVGNVLNYDTGEGVVPTVIDWQDIKCCEEMEGHFNNGHSPVLITDEVMARCQNVISHRGPIIKSYAFDISRHSGHFKQLSMTIKSGNTYVYLRHGEATSPRHHDSIITVFNGDVNGKLYLHWLQNMYFVLTGEEIVYTP